MVYEDWGIPGVVEKEPLVDERLVHVLKVRPSRRKPATNRRNRNVMPALTDTFGNSRDGRFCVREPEEDESHIVTSVLPLRDRPRIAVPAECRLHGKAIAPCHCFINQRKKKASRANGGPVGIERRKPGCDEVGVQKASGSEFAWEILSGERSLASPVRAGKDDSMRLVSHHEAAY